MGDAPGREQVRVLVVEDDRRLASSVRRGLSEAGFAVDTVHDGEEAVAAALTTSYDVLLLDMMLPKLDGIEVCRQLRRGRMRAPILMLTALEDVDDRVKGLDSGADDYLSKPFALREVIARIRALSRRNLPDRSAVLTAGVLALDTGGHTFKVRDVEVPLTAKEYSILEYLMLNRGLLLSRDQILGHVWSYDFEGGHNLIEVYIGRLRKKLAEAGAGDPLVTVRGAGYRLEAGPP